MNNNREEDICPELFLNNGESEDNVGLYCQHYCEDVNDSLSDQASISFSDILEDVLAVPQNLDTFSEKHGSCLMEYDVPDPNDFTQKFQFKGNKRKSTESNAITMQISFETVQVQCLQSIENLKKVCEEQGLKFNTYIPNNEELYEVDMIYGHGVHKDQMWYFVKWKNYETQFNTWEPACNLTGCTELITYFNAIQIPKIKIDKNHLTFFVEDLITRKPYDILTMIKVCAFYSKKSEKHMKSLNLNELKTGVKKLLKFSLEKLRQKSSQTALLSLMKFRESRKQVLIDLQEWEKEINSNMPDNSAYVQVENNEDLENSPKDFQFINDYINTVFTPKVIEPVTFCKCEDCFTEKNSCCPKDSEGKFAYNKNKRLILEPGYPIFECNDKCSCSEDCTNRVVQNGSKIKVAIFRTSNGTGWGLKTLETIEKGQFVLEYLGEVITSEVAEARGSIYDYVRRSYLFDLDYGVDDTSCCYTVDAGHLGNSSHFINHSCNPNLHVFAVWINDQDPYMPRLAFFAKRKINQGEELTFDYKMQKDRFDSGRLSDDSVRMPCKCNSFNCRKFLF